MAHQKLGRNDPCHCGSGKKYKKCCEEKDLHRKISAQKLTPEQAKSSLMGRVSQASSVFKRLPPATPAAEPPHKQEAPENPTM